MLGDKNISIKFPKYNSIELLKQISQNEDAVKYLNEITYLRITVLTCILIINNIEIRYFSVLRK